MRTMKHGNGTPVARLYTFTDYDKSDKQGPIIAFNVLKNDGR